MRIGVDVGGTFTDLVVADSSRGVWFVKTPSTPDDPSVGVVDGLKLIARELSLPLEEVLKQVEVFIHGTTVATNILMQRNGARIGLLTTAGFRDLLELRDGTKTGRYQLREKFPEMLVPRPRRLEVDERVRWDGSIETAIEPDEVDAAIRALMDEGVEAVVACFLHSHQYPHHERLVRERAQALGCDAYLTLSHEILPREGEYNRLSTAVVNAYVGPGLSRYLQRLADDLAEKGVRAPLLIMQSNGGVLSAEDAARRAVGAVTSGPAGGAMAGVLFARAGAIERAVAYDTGGTSTDISVIEDGTPVETNIKVLADTRIAGSTIEVNPLAIGGGSIARIDSGGILDLGPRSAGAVPGPACFGHGGTEPTLTDANVVLGYISTETFLDGRMRLSHTAAATAVKTHIADRLGLSVEQAALAIHALATSRITEGVRLATIRRGADPRDFALLSFGGAGGLHANAVASELQIPRAIIPRQAAVLSALGFLAADVRQDHSRQISRKLLEIDGDALIAIIRDLEQKGRSAIRKDGFEDGQIYCRVVVDCRYERQTNSIPIEIEPGELEAGVATLGARFQQAYDGLYHHHHKLEQAVIDSVHVAAFGRLPTLELPASGATDDPDPSPARRGSRRIFLSEWIEAPVYWFDSIVSGMRIKGPALVDSASTTVLIRPGSEAGMDRIGSLCIWSNASR